MYSYETCQFFLRSAFIVVTSSLMPLQGIQRLSAFSCLKLCFSKACQRQGPCFKFIISCLKEKLICLRGVWVAVWHRHNWTSCSEMPTHSLQWAVCVYTQCEHEGKNSRCCNQFVMHDEFLMPMLCIGKVRRGNPMASKE